MTRSEVSSLAETKAHLSELESLEETIAVLSDAATMNTLDEADAELARGELENQSSLAVAMRERRARGRPSGDTSWSSPPPPAGN